MMATFYQRNGRWYYQFFDHTGKRRTKSAKTTEYKVAERIARKHEAEAVLRSERVIDPREEAIDLQLKRPLSQHLSDFRAKLKTAGRDRQYIADTLTILRKMTTACEFRAAADIDADRVNQNAVDLQDEGRSARTVQNHLTAIKSFTKWMTRTGKLLSDPLVTVSKPSPKDDRRLERRMMLPDEWAWLRTVTRSEGVERFGIGADERVLLYATAVQTGLRSSELRSLTRGRLSLDRDDPFITCKAGQTKNRTNCGRRVLTMLQFSRHLTRVWLR